MLYGWQIHVGHDISGEVWQGAWQEVLHSPSLPSLSHKGHLDANLMLAVAVAVERQQNKAMT